MCIRDRFCNLHELEIKGIADGDVAKGIKAYNPILAGQLSREEIELCSKDPNKKLNLLKKLDEVELKTSTPLTKIIPSREIGLVRTKHSDSFSRIRVCKTTPEHM